MLRCLFGTKQAIASIGENPQNSDGSIKGEESDEAITAVPRSFMDIVGLTGIGSSIATMALTTGHVVDIASFSTLLLAPYAAIQKRTLRNLGGMRGQQNELRANVNFLYQQNNVLFNRYDCCNWLRVRRRSIAAVQLAILHSLTLSLVFYSS